jgi:NADPH:quinone reductase-like Zn-dependent oxidoreductase
MKAVVYEKNNPTGPLVYREIERPTPGDNQVLVKIHAASVNAADYRSMRMGTIPKSKIFGVDIAGVVAGVGREVKKFKVGDLVFGDISASGSGGFAEYVVTAEKFLTTKPANVPFDQAAALPMAGVTALQGLRECGKIHAGQKVLICGAGGGVGNFAVQIAKHFGTEVTATCSAANAEFVRSLGANRVLDYAVEDFATAKDCYDLVLVVNGGRPLSDYKSVLTPGGICVIAGGPLSQVIKALVAGPFTKFGKRKIGVLAGKPNAQDQAWLINLVQEKKLRVMIERHYPLSETAAAMRYLGQGHARGKVVIDIATL